MISVKKCSGIAAILILAARLLAESNEPVRLALIAETGEASAASDVLTVQLSRNPKIHLLERNEIEKVYREQGLSAANRDYLKLGQLLGADGLLLLETVQEDANEYLNIRLIAVKPGIVMTSQRFLWPIGDPTNWAGGFANHFEPLFPKLTVPVRDAVPISVVNLRSAFQSPADRELERNVTFLAIERLSRECEVFVLERRRMQLLSAEKEWENADESAFWGGGYLLEGTLDRDGYSADKITLNARLIPPRGRTPLPIEVSGSRTNISEIVSQLTVKILDCLKVRPGTAPWEPAEEAKQYEEEARWALRWGLYEIAQSASESAWVLGRRSKDLAALRIRAYSDSIWPIDGSSWNIMIPVVPDAASLRPATRALTLFGEDSPLVLANIARPDLEWFELGVKALERAAGLLDGFYHTAELQRGNEESMAELRDATRRLLPNLDAQARLVGDIRRQFSPGKRSPKGLRFEGQAFQNYDRLRLVQWDQGGVCFEKPEDALPLFREMLAAGYVPEDLPRIIGWSWEDRKRVPQVMKQFLGELCASSDPEVRLAGLYLAMLRTPHDGTGSLEAAEHELLAAMWEQRTNLYANAERASLLTQTQKALQKKYGYELLIPFDHEPFASFRRRLRKDYLVNATDWNEMAFRELFHNDFQTYAMADAQELLPLLQQLNQRWSSNEWSLARLQEEMQTMARATGTPLPAPSGPTQPERERSLSPPAAQPEIIQFIPWILRSNPIWAGLHPQMQKLLLRNGKLWALVCYVETASRTPFNSPTSFVTVDPETGNCEELAFPEELGFPGRAFDVTSDSLFVGLQNQLARYRFNKSAWESMPLPTESSGSITALNGRVYLANAESLLEVDPETHAIQMLASSRRRPPANEVDSMWGPQAGVFAAWSNKLGVLTTNDLYLFDPAGRVWEKVAVPEHPPRSRSSWFAPGQVWQLCSWGFQSPGARRHLVEFSANHTRPELLLEQVAGKNPPDSAAEGLSQDQPRWSWPEPFRLDFPSFVPEKECLWSLQPRKFRWSFAYPPEEPVRFADDRNATLFRFEPDIRQAFSMPLRFERNGKVIDPFDLRVGGPPPNPAGPTIPQWLVTDKGVMVGCSDQAGHWLISKSVLDRRWEALRKSARERPDLEATSQTTIETNANSR